MSKRKLDRIHDALKQHVADGKLPGTVVPVARKGKLIYAAVATYVRNAWGNAAAPVSADQIRSLCKELRAKLQYRDVFSLIVSRADT